MSAKHLTRNTYAQMESNSVGREDSHVVAIWEECVAQMEKRISETTPHLLRPTAGKGTCCIFRVPLSLIEINGQSYHPTIVSIGPYHRGEPHLQMMEEHKWWYLRSLLSRTKGSKGITLDDYLKSIYLLENDARECYSETIHLSSYEFLEMMVLDGCFMLEMFRKVNNLKLFDAEDPLSTMAWVLPFFSRDFLRLENQIPFFVLERLFEISRMPEESGPSLSLLAMQFFNNSMQRSNLERFNSLKGLHLLDLVRSSYLTLDENSPPHKENTTSHFIHNVSKLRRAGIKLNQLKDEDSFLVVKFRHGVIEMPCITIDDFMTCFLVNCVAFEQCHNSDSKPITTYATFLDYLVNTAKDVEYLSESNIIENQLGSEEEVARFINNLGQEVAFDIDKCYLSRLFYDVHHYYNNSRHVQWATFKYTYFNTPWSFISALAAFVLLVLAFLQTGYTMYPYLHG